MPIRALPGNVRPISFYATKDGKISVTIRGWDQSKTVLAGQTVCAELGASTPCGPNHRCPSAQVLTLKMTPSFIRADGSGLRA